MAKNTSTASAPETASASDEVKSRKHIQGTEELPRNPDGSINFDAADGEAYVGLNVLALEVGQADGPFTVVNIIPTDFGAGKAKKSINVLHCMKGSTPVQMPIAASFITKAEEAKLAKGDKFIVQRGPNFKSKQYGTENCQSYLVKVLSRG